MMTRRRNDDRAGMWGLRWATLLVVMMAWLEVDGLVPSPYHGGMRFERRGGGDGVTTHNKLVDRGGVGGLGRVDALGGRRRRRRMSRTIVLEAGEGEMEGPQWKRVTKGARRWLEAVGQHRKRRQGPAGSSYIEDDGYSVGLKKKRTWWRRWPKTSGHGSSSAKVQPGEERQPGALILVRHGESTWNQNSTFTGWADPDLSARGERENAHAARLLMAAGYTVDVAYTSRLKRAIRTTWIILMELGQVYRPVFKSWRLNERCYGALTGLSKPGLAMELGEERVQAWRHGLRDRPPPMLSNHSLWPGRERKYADLPGVPATESLLDTAYRTLPLWRARIERDLLEGNNVMVVAHGNSLRGLVSYVDSISDEDIVEVSIPNGCPLVYKFERVAASKGGKPTLKPLVSPNAIAPLSGEFLEKKGALRAALARENELVQHIPGYDRDLADVSPALRSLAKLELERRLIDLAGEPVAYLDDDGERRPPKTGAALHPADADANSAAVESSEKNSVPTTLSATPTGETAVFPTTLSSGGPAPAFKVEDAMYMGFPASGVAPVDAQPPKKVSDSDDDDSKYGDALSSTATGTRENDERDSDVSMLYGQSTAGWSSGRQRVATTGLNHPKKKKKKKASNLDDKGPLIIIIRHGKTTANLLGIFTGWEDVPLAAEGRREAKRAGQLLRRHGVELDVVYTSWLSRAIETAWLVLTELDSLWIPLVKSWRLNERHYGSLTGLSKKMIAQIHGEAQFKKWRRGYTQRPPAVSSFSQHYPGNDERYVKYVTDLDVSLRESVVRTFADGRLTVARNLPKCESLKDCMERTIPFYTQVIAPVAKRRNVLIASSENAIRGLLMELCEIPEDRISEVEIPTGLPLIYLPRTKCLRLLDDGHYDADPVKALDRHDFGAAVDLLFKPCDPDKSQYCEVDPETGLISDDPIIRLAPEVGPVLAPDQAEFASVAAAVDTGLIPPNAIPSPPSTLDPNQPGSVPVR